MTVPPTCSEPQQGPLYLSAISTFAIYDTLGPVALPNTTMLPLGAVYLGQTWPRWFVGSTLELVANATQ